MFTYCRWITLLSVIVLSALSSELARATIAANEPCEGWAIVSPPKDNFGSVYMGPHLIRREPKGIESYPRMGYLPSGTVIKLAEPEKGRSVHLHHCGFRFRKAIVGHIDRRHVTKLDKVIRALKKLNPEMGKLSDNEIAFI
jgi:hypothetical protein